ncbi:MAG TPA: hypothetical protein VH234_06050 [Candidatus Saccharimonadales bacterium]|jgi:hypothetical protein|nr:hypothetical protein [Candidatus Saccharimonadales bacterium]
MAEQKREGQYNNSLNWLLATPVITVAIAWASNVITGNRILIYPIHLVAFACVAYLYWAQIKYLKAYYPHKRIDFQIYIMLVALCVPFVGIYLGDYGGASNFQVAANGLRSDIEAGLILGGVLASLYLFVSAISNAFYIRTGGKNSILRVLGKILYVLGYIVVAAVTWFGYSLVYSLHDPSTE